MEKQLTMPSFFKWPGFKLVRTLSGRTCDEFDPIPPCFVFCRQRISFVSRKKTPLWRFHNGSETSLKRLSVRPKEEKVINWSLLKRDKTLFWVLIGVLHVDVGAKRVTSADNKSSLIKWSRSPSFRFRISKTSFHFSSDMHLKPERDNPSKNRNSNDPIKAWH